MDDDKNHYRIPRLALFAFHSRTVPIATVNGALQAPLTLQTYLRANSVQTHYYILLLFLPKYLDDVYVYFSLVKYIQGTVPVWCMWLTKVWTGICMTYVQMQYVQGAPLGLLQSNKESVQRDFRAINAAKPHYNKAASDTKMTVTPENSL